MLIRRKPWFLRHVATVGIATPATPCVSVVLRHENALADANVGDMIGGLTRQESDKNGWLLWSSAGVEELEHTLNAYYSM